MADMLPSTWQVGMKYLLTKSVSTTPHANKRLTFKQADT